MALMHSTDNYSAEEQQVLLSLVRQSISDGLEGREPVRPEGVSLPAALENPRACFVTLRLQGRLRGCIGNLEASGSLIDAVLRNGYLAAFRDQRFEPVNEQESDDLEIEISILTPMVPLPVETREELLQKLKPGVDGLLIEMGSHRATFLPSVWDELSDPGLFLSHLLRKAGLSQDFWSDEIKCWTYRAIKIKDRKHDQS